MPLDPDDAWLRATGLPAQVGGLMSTRVGGVSAAPFDSLIRRSRPWVEASSLRPSTITGLEK